MNTSPTPPTTIALHDGRAMRIRPLTPDDRGALLQFGNQLPQDDWLYLENDLRAPDVVTRLTNAYAAEHWRQVVACDDAQHIAAYASVRTATGRSSHVAYVQLIVGEGWRRNGLGRAMGQVVFAEAQKLQASKVVAEMMEAQRSGQAIFARLGFRIEGTLRGHARDRFGHRHNVVVMATLLN
jgi:L-amino acid N-acyltransferase YncA